VVIDFVTFDGKPLRESAYEVEMIEAWHFIPVDGRLQYGKRRTVVRVGQTLRRDPEKLELCKYGLHASIKPLDALRYAPGPIVCRVQCSGKVIEDSDKLVCSRRKTLWMYDATPVLRSFARWCALQVVHLWDCPPVTLEYLKTGREGIRVAARAAAWAAASDAASDAARAAAWAAASDAASDAAWAAAASDAAWAAAARAAARAAAWAAQNTKLEEMLIGGQPDCRAHRRGYCRNSDRQ